VYFPIRQQIKEIDEMAEGMTYEVRAAGDPTALVTAIREAVRSVDSKIPIMNVKTQTDQIDQTMNRERVFARLTTSLGGLVLVLAALGLYGVMSYNVTRRTKEIGIRMALGAGARRVLGQLMRETLRVVAVGIVLGIVASYVASGLVTTALIGIEDDRTMLFGVSAHDPVSIGLAAVFLLAVAAIAGDLPARKAAQAGTLVAFR